MALKDVTIENIEQAVGRPLSEEEQTEVILWQKGKALQQLSAFPGWQVVLEMLESYAQNSTDECVRTDPGQPDEVRANQAVAFAMRRVVNSLLSDINAAVNADIPDVIRSGARASVSAIPLESM